MVWYSGQRAEKSLAVKLDTALNKTDCEQHLTGRSDSALNERIGMLRSQLITTMSILNQLSKSITPVASLAKVPLLAWESVVVLGTWRCAVLGGQGSGAGCPVG